MSGQNNSLCLCVARSQSPAVQTSDAKRWSWNNLCDCWCGIHCHICYVNTEAFTINCSTKCCYIGNAFKAPEIGEAFALCRVWSSARSESGRESNVDSIVLA